VGKSLKERILEEMVVDDCIAFITQEIFEEVTKRRDLLKEKFLKMSHSELWDYIRKRVEKELKKSK